MWSDREGCAIADVEKWTDWLPLEGRVGKLWLCNCIRLHGVTVYLAHRAGTNKVLYSYGAVELGLEIISFAMEAPKDAEPVPA